MGRLGLCSSQLISVSTKNKGSKLKYIKEEMIDKLKDIAKMMVDD